MCSSYLSKPLRTEEQAIIDLIRSGSHVVVPREATEAVVEAGRMTEVNTAWVADFGKGYAETVTVPIAVALLDTQCRDVDDAIRRMFAAMVARGAITLTDRQKEAD